MKKIFSIGFLPLFVFTAVYFCPCKPMFKDLAVSSVSSHECCEKMPNCPEKDKPKNIESLSGFAVQPNIQSSTLQNTLQPAVVHVIERVLSKPSRYPPDFQSEFFSASPPDLFIQYEALLF